MSWTSCRPCTSTTLPATQTGEMICQAPSSAALRSAGSTELSTKLSANAGPDRTTCALVNAQKSSRAGRCCRRLPMLSRPQ